MFSGGVYLAERGATGRVNHFGLSHCFITHTPCSLMSTIFKTDFFVFSRPCLWPIDSLCSNWQFLDSGPKIETPNHNTCGHASLASYRNIKYVLVQDTYTSFSLKDVLSSAARYYLLGRELDLISPPRNEHSHCSSKYFKSTSSVHWFKHHLHWSSSSLHS